MYLLVRQTIPWSHLKKNEVLLWYFGNGFTMVLRYIQEYHEFQSSISIQYHYCTMVLPQDTRLYFIHHGTEVHLYIWYFQYHGATITHGTFFVSSSVLSETTTKTS